MKKIKLMQSDVILLEEFKKPFNISQNDLANSLKVTFRGVVISNAAHILSKVFGTKCKQTQQ